MTKEKILELFYDTVLRSHYTDNAFDEIADKLLGLFKQEKKETAKEIFERIFSDDTAGDLGEFCGWGWIYDIDEAKAIAKAYGVEL